MDRHQGWAQRPDRLRVPIYMRVHPLKVARASLSAAASAVSQAAAAASVDPQTGPVYIRPELISGGNAPKSIFDDLRVPWLSGRFADVAADLAQ